MFKVESWVRLMDVLVGFAGPQRLTEFKCVLGIYFTQVTSSYRLKCFIRCALFFHRIISEKEFSLAIIEIWFQQYSETLFKKVVKCMYIT